MTMENTVTNKLAGTNFEKPITKIADCILSWLLSVIIVQFEPVS